MRSVWRRSIMMVVLSSLTGLLVVPVNRAADLDETEFRKLYRQLQPAPNELWRTIPWRISLLEAQRAAAKEKKPIFIWAMDGHPLGCT